MNINFTTKIFSSLTSIELYQIMVLRQEVFVVEQDCPYLDADNKDQDSLHLLGMLDGKLLAYARLVPKGISYQKYTSIGRVVTHHSIRNKGVGKLLMQSAIESCYHSFGNDIVKISAQSHLATFYNAFGFESVGEGYLEDNIPHIGMLLQHNKT